MFAVRHAEINLEKDLRLSDTCANNPSRRIRYHCRVQYDEFIRLKEMLVHIYSCIRYHYPWMSGIMISPVSVVLSRLLAYANCS